MPRIPDDEIERLKADLSLIRFMEAQGLKLKKQGKDWVTRCPFHDDTTPSLVVSPDNNLWHCLGACNMGGSVIDWVMQSEGVSFKHAVELLREHYQPASVNPVKQATVRKLDSPLAADADDHELLSRVIDYYHRSLKQSPDALAYLEKRGLTHPDVIDHFKLGFANRTLAYRLPAKNRKDGAAIRTRLQTLGILRDSGHEHFNGCLVIPVFDAQQNIVECYGRKLLGKRLRKGTPQHLYLPGPHRGVFNLAALQHKELILCESLIDALTFWCAGYRNVTTSYGVNGFTDEHLAQLKKNHIERVLIAYDRDDAGNNAAETLAKKLIAEGIDAYRVQFPKGMDANEYALHVQPATKSLGVVIRSAMWLGKGKAKAITTTAIQTNPIAEQMTTTQQTNHSSALVAELENVAESLTTPLPATPLPDAPKLTTNAEVKDNEITFTFGERRYRVRGFDHNPNVNVLKINLLVSGPGLHGQDAIHVDTLDLYQSRARGVYCKHAALELGVEEKIIKHDLGQLLLQLEALQEEAIQAEANKTIKPIELNEPDKQAALQLLKQPGLLNAIKNDFKHSGLVGEDTNALVGYLAAVSRKLQNPLAILVQSTSAAGKSSLMDAVLQMMPSEERIQYSAMTGQSLYYMSEQNLQHKILAIVEEAGAEKAAYALKLLQSEGELTIASTSKDPQSGKLITQEYRVEGPVMIFLTTTAIDVDEELLNRCLVLTVNEDREQTQSIHHQQRKKRTLAGLQSGIEKEAVIQLHQNAQRLLKPLAIVNPYAEHLTFVDHQTRTRRDHEKYLTLIDAIALLHQYQREIKTIQHQNKTVQYIEVTLDDIDAANNLAHDILGRTLDELPPQTRKLLILIHDMVIKQCEQHAMPQRDVRFSRRDIRAFTQWSDGQLKIHCRRLEDMEYLLAHRGGRGQSFVYELLYDRDPEQTHTHLMGLIDPKKLTYDAEKLGQKAKKTGPSQGQVSPTLGSSQTDQNTINGNDDKALAANKNNNNKNTYIRDDTKPTSYPQPLAANTPHDRP